MNDAATAMQNPELSLDALSDEELVDRFLFAANANRQIAHQCFEIIISRYNWLISHVVRNSHYRFPAWDSADDCIARAIFKIYRGLAKWRREGKLSSFIARITSSEMIDTIRRIRRDKSWNPRLSEAVEEEEEKPTAIDRAASPEPSPEAELLNRQQRELVDSLLEEVCRDWKDSVIVSDYIILNLGAKEIMAKYDMSEDVIYQRAHRLKARLIKALDERGITSTATLLGAGAKKKK